MQLLPGSCSREERCRSVLWLVLLDIIPLEEVMKSPVPWHGSQCHRAGVVVPSLGSMLPSRGTWTSRSGHQTGTCAAQGQLNSCSSPEACRGTPAGSYFRERNPLEHWRQVCCVIHGDQYHKEKAKKQSNPIGPCLNDPDTSLQLCKVSYLFFSLGQRYSMVEWMKIYHQLF